MIAIALVDQNWGIAANGKQITFIPDDLKRFREITKGHPVIMGRKTYESLPGKRPLPGRRNIILSRNMTEAPEGFELGSLMANEPDTCVIGGEAIYAQLLPLCNRVYLTVVEHDFNADQFFPNLAMQAEDWELTSRSEDMMYNGLVYHYDIYTRIGLKDSEETPPMTKEDLHEFNKTEILVIAEQLINQTKLEYPNNDEAQASAILANLSILCYSQGMNYVVLNMNIKKYPNRDDIFADVIKEAQKRWEWIIAYCKDTLNIELHPLGMLFVLRFVTSGEHDLYAPHVLAGIERVSRELDKKIAEDVKVAEAKPVPEIDEFDGDIPTLIMEYFKLLEEIGTFYRDRDKYETEEQKLLHDRIVAIYRKIGKSM